MAREQKIKRFFNTLHPRQVYMYTVCMYFKLDYPLQNIARPILYYSLEFLPFSSSSSSSSTFSWSVAAQCSLSSSFYSSSLSFSSFFSLSSSTLSVLPFLLYPSPLPPHSPPLPPPLPLSLSSIPSPPRSAPSHSPSLHPPSPSPPLFSLSLKIRFSYNLASLE